MITPCDCVTKAVYERYKIGDQIPIMIKKNIWGAEEYRYIIGSSYFKTSMGNPDDYDVDKNRL